MPFSTEELSLIEAIHADPKNDGPRKDYASWCVDNGLSDLAEFIRVQLEGESFSLANPQSPGLAHWSEIDDESRVTRASGLLMQIYPSERFPIVGYWDEYYRGLPLYEVVLTDEDLAKSVADFNLLTPLARLHVWIKSARLPDWPSHPLLYFADRVILKPPPEPGSSILGIIGMEGIEAIAHSPLNGRLEELILCGYVPDEVRRTAEHLVDMPVSVWE